MRKVRAAVAGIVLIVLVVGCVAALRGSVALVETHGISMSPRITTGDLVVVAEQPSYREGEVVAYHSRELRQVVLHRIRAIEDGRYTFRGDHNDFDDPEQPGAGQLIGREVLHIPQGSVWLDRLGAPPILAVVAFLVMAGGGGAASRRRTRRRRMRATAQHARPMTEPRRFGGRSRTSAAAALLATAISVVGVALSGVAWATPATEPGSASTGPKVALTFSYRAEVPPSPAYQGTTVTAPDPLFRSVVDTVDLSYAYIGAPGTIRLDAELSSAVGWHTRIPLQPATRFDDPHAVGRVQFDLDDAWRRAVAASAVIGVTLDEVSVAVVATVRSADGGTFAPRLAFALTATQLRLASDGSSLAVRDNAEPVVGAARPNRLEILGISTEVSTLRVAAGGSTAVALSALALWLLAGGRRSGNESRIGPWGYGGLFLEVEPIPSPPGRTIVDVADFAALARLARRYGVLVMHWTQMDVRTFVVHDDGITYRHRVDVTPGGAPPSGPHLPRDRRHAAAPRVPATNRPDTCG